MATTAPKPMPNGQGSLPKPTGTDWPLGAAAAAGAPVQNDAARDPQNWRVKPDDPTWRC
jgi:hypothetical protein